MIWKKVARTAAVTGLISAGVAADCLIAQQPPEVQKQINDALLPVAGFAAGGVVAAGKYLLELREQGRQVDRAIDYADTNLLWEVDLHQAVEELPGLIQVALNADCDGLAEELVVKLGAAQQLLAEDEIADPEEY